MVTHPIKSAMNARSLPLAANHRRVQRMRVRASVCVRVCQCVCVRVRVFVRMCVCARAWDRTMSRGKLKSSCWMLLWNSSCGRRAHDPPNAHTVRHTQHEIKPGGCRFCFRGWGGRKRNRRPYDPTTPCPPPPPRHKAKNSARDGIAPRRTQPGRKPLHVSLHVSCRP
jgi:hypothetical protein